MEDNTRLEALLNAFSALPGAKILVHGGGRKATAVAAKMGLESQMVNGRRITDEAMMEVVTMVYGGLVNKQIVAQLQARSVAAVGLTGADFDVVRSHRRLPTLMEVEGPGQQLVDFGQVGDVDGVLTAPLLQLLQSGVTPVLAPLTHDGQGHLLNTNADTIAAEVAKALAQVCEVTLIYAFEKPGVLERPDDASSVIPIITPTSFADLCARGIISGGMIPKVENALKAVQAGVRRVVITEVPAFGPHQGTVVQA